MEDVAMLDRAAAAIRNGELIVYPTETVYGLGADALSQSAIEQVFESKRRDRNNPISLAVPNVNAVRKYANPTERELAFCRKFLPGPVTVVLPASEEIPSVLTGGRDRVGVRVPNHEKAQSVLEKVAPITATSANVSGRNSARRVEKLDPEISKGATIVIDGGETPGGGSTVVDVGRGVVLRAGRNVGAIRDWLSHK